MKKLLVIPLVVALAGCASFNPFGLNPNLVTPNQADIAINAFDGLEATAANYLSLPVCGSVPCRSQKVSTSIAAAVRAGRTARDQIDADLKTNIAVPITLLQTLQTAVATLQTLNAQ